MELELCAQLCSVCTLQQSQIFFGLPDELNWCMWETIIGSEAICESWGELKSLYLQQPAVYVLQHTIHTIPLGKMELIDLQSLSIQNSIYTTQFEHLLTLLHMIIIIIIIFFCFGHARPATQESTGICKCQRYSNWSWKSQRKKIFMCYIIDVSVFGGEREHPERAGLSNVRWQSSSGDSSDLSLASCVVWQKSTNCNIYICLSRV